MTGLGLGKGEDFYQSEPLTTRLKNLIRDYPEGVGILKELIQNADDAGATRIEIIFDWRTHDFEQLPDPRMKALMGAAMLVYNDSIFTNKDFDNIQRLGDSSKRDDLWKTGRFGVGFNSVYHVTDYPNFISRDRIVFFDPHASAIPEVTLSRPGKGWRLDEEGWWNYPDYMKVYEPGGLQSGTTHFEGTLFRLPLRTAEHAKQSKIRSEPFNKENVQQLLTEFVKDGEEMLLFLKSLLTIQVREIDTDGNQQDLLTITTQNADVVALERKKMLVPLQTGTQALITQCQENPSSLPAVSYQHTIEVTTPKKHTISTWRVSSLIRAENALLNLIRQLDKQGEKAVPWAGVAALISREGDLQQTSFIGRAYCFLPLPQETDLPVHVNGFFDLDSSRRELTSDSLTGRDSRRVEWNQLLVRHVLSHAYAELLVSLVNDVGESDPRKFYDFFPTQRLTKALVELPNHVITLLQSKRVIRSAIAQSVNIQINGQRRVGKSHWVLPHKINVLPAEWGHLLEALHADKVNLPDPPIPPVLEASFSRAGVPLKTFGPENLRERLLTREELGMPVEVAPRVCLRKPEWITSLLLYCLSDGCRDVRGLPLALMADGTLQSFGYSSSQFIYVVEPKNRQILMEQIFVSRSDWFLDVNLVDQISNLEQCQGVSIFPPVEVAKRLKDLLDSDDSDVIPWDPNGQRVPNSNWLEHVYRYLVSVSKLPVDELVEVPLVPGNDGFLHAGGRAVTPLYASRPFQQTLDTLKYFGIPIIEAQQELGSAIAAFYGRHRDTLFFQLTVPDLIDTLYILHAKQALPSYNLGFYNELLSFLTDRDWIHGDGRSDEKRKQKLRQLQMYLTTGGDLTALENVYTPGGYTPPRVAGSFTLLRLGPDDKSVEWKLLYDFLDVPILDHVTMIQNLLKDYDGLRPDDQVEALEWIRDHLSIAQSEQEKQRQPSDLKKRVREAPLIRCTDGNRRAANSIYNPNPKFYKEVRSILGDRAHTPDMAVYADNPEHWLDFFGSLGMLISPSARDILAYVDGQIRQAQNGVTDAIAQSLTNIFEYLKEHWEQLNRERLPSNRTLTEELKDRAWLPVERDPDKLRRFSTFCIPQNRLYKSTEVHFSPYGYRVASQKPLFVVSQLPKSEFQQALGFLFPEAEDVVNHFKALTQLWETAEESSVEKAAFQQSINSVYTFFDIRFLRGQVKEESRQWLREQLKGYRCLWNSGKFWKPEHTFQINVSFFGKYRQKIAPPSPIREVYTLLGQKRQPEIEDYLNFLEELAEHSMGTALSEEDSKHVCDVLNLLMRDLEVEELAAADYDLLLLSDDNLLLPPEQILIADAPWRLEAISDRQQVKILHPNVPDGLAIAAGSRSLLKDVSEIPTSITLTNERSAIEVCQKWQSLLRSPEFMAGLERLIADEYGLDIKVKLSWITRIEVKAAQTITTKLELDNRCIASGLNGNYYFEPDNYNFYLSQKNEKLMLNYLTEGLNYQLGNYRLSNSARLQMILDSSPSEIEQLLDELRVKRLKRANLAIPASDETDEIAVDQIFDTAVLDGDEADLADEDTVTSGNGHKPASTTVTDSDSSSVEKAIANPNTNSSASNGAAAIPTSTSPTAQSATASGASTNGASAKQSSNNSGSIAAATNGAATESEDSTEESDQVRPKPLIQPAQPAPSISRISILDIKPSGQDSVVDDSDEDESEDDTATTAGRTPSIRTWGGNTRRPRSGGGQRRSGGNGSRKRRSPTTYANQQYRNGVRVRFERRTDTSQSQDSQAGLSESERKKIDRAGMTRVMEYERRHGRFPSDMNQVYQNNAGYDIKSKDPKSGEERYIEVKSLRGVWDRRGVCMTLKQFETGREKKDKFWLYVVELAETGKAKVIPIQDPVRLVGEFYYDDSWRQLADREGG